MRPSRVEFKRMIDNHEFENATAAVYDQLHGDLGQTYLKLTQIRDALGPRDANNCYLFDDVQKCIVLAGLLDKAIGALVTAPITVLREHRDG